VFKAIVRLMLCAYSLMFINSVDTTLLLLCTAVTACFASSLTVVNAAPPRTNPPDATSTLLLRLLFGIGFAGGVVAKARRLGGSACLRQFLQVHGIARRKKGEMTLDADIMHASL
jgi:ABC-type iron transport system FetAB permease component